MYNDARVGKYIELALGRQAYSFFFFFFWSSQKIFSDVIIMSWRLRTVNKNVVPNTKQPVLTRLVCCAPLVRYLFYRYIECASETLVLVFVSRAPAVNELNFRKAIIYYTRRSTAFRATFSMSTAERRRSSFKRSSPPHRTHESCECANVCYRGDRVPFNANSPVSKRRDVATSNRTVDGIISCVVPLCV